MKIARDLTIVLILIVVAVFLLVAVRGMDSKIDVTQEEVDVDEEMTEEEEESEYAFITGVAGQVLVGPQCPVMQEGESCPDAPFEGIVDVVVADPERELIARVRTDSNGQFATALPAGEFALVVQTGTGPFPLCPEEQVSVAEGEVIEVTISCDTGIR